MRKNDFKIITIINIPVSYISSSMFKMILTNINALALKTLKLELNMILLQFGFWVLKKQK